MTSRRSRPAFAVAVVSLLLGAKGQAFGQAAAGQPPRGQTPMNMANMDHRGGIRGAVRGASDAPAADITTSVE